MNLNSSYKQQSKIQQLSVSRKGSAQRFSDLIEKFIFSSLIVLFVIVAVPYGTVEIWWVVFFECSIFTLGALRVIVAWLRGAWHISEPKLFLPVIGIALLAFVQILPSFAFNAELMPNAYWTPLSADYFATRLWLTKLCALIVCAELLMFSTVTRKRLRVLIATVISIGVASAIFGITRQMLQTEDAGFFLPSLAPNVGYAQFINQNHFAFLMEMTVGLILGLIVGGDAGRKRLVVYIGAIVPMIGALVLTKSRGGFIALGCQLLLLALVFGFVRSVQVKKGFTHSISYKKEQTGIRGRIFGSPVTRLILILCLVMATFFGTLWTVSEDRSLVDRLQTVSEEFDTEGFYRRDRVRRLDIWQATWEVIKKQPIAGVGFGAYRVAVTQYFDSPGNWTLAEAHNDYLELVVGGGLIAALLGIWFVGRFIKQALVRLHSGSLYRRSACLGSLVGLLGAMVHSLVDFGFHVTINAVVFIVLIVISTVKDSTNQHPLESFKEVTQ